MYRFQDNLQTQYMIDAILELDREALVEVSETDFWKNLDNQKPFRDGINARLAQMDCSIASDDTRGKVRFITEQFSKHGIEPISEPTLKNWLTASAPDDNEKSREKVYRLCFALEMNTVETAEFFFKSYLTRPFNYKDTAEAVYFHCLLTGKPYADAVRLLKEVEAVETKIHADRDIATEELGNEIAQISDERELINFLSEHRYTKAEQYQTVTNRISELLQRCYTAATQEMPYINDKPRMVDNDDVLLDVIFDFDAAKMTQSIAKSALPKSLKAYWPDRQTLANIKKHNIGAEALYRKTLILLTFYDFYAKAYVAQRIKKKEVDMIGLADEFETELDQVLAECGYIQMYKRNPFDSLIFYCMSFQNPLEQFRLIIAEFYLDKVDPTEEKT